MKFKSKKITLIAVSIVVLSVILSIATQVFAELPYQIATKKPYYNSRTTTTDGYPSDTVGDRYTVGGDEQWKLGELIQGNIDYDSKSIYCMDIGRGFTGGAGIAQIVPYGKLLDIRTPADFFEIYPKSTYPEIYPDSTDDTLTQRRILWILDNMFVRGNTDSKTMLLDAAYKYAYENTDFMYDFPYLRGEHPGTLSVQHAEEIIEIVQQYALWYFTNPIEFSGYEMLEIKLNESDMPWGWGDDDNEATALYKYLINSAKKYAHIDSNSSKTTNIYELDSTGEYRAKKPIVMSGSATILEPVTISGVDYYKAGPFTYDEVGGLYKITGFEGLVKNGAIQSSITSNVKIIYKDKSNTERTYNVGSVPLPETVAGKDIFVAIPASAVNLSTITEIGLKINYTYDEFSGEFLTVSGQESDTQPIIIVEKTPNPDSIQGLLPWSLNTSFSIKLTKVDYDNQAVPLPGATFKLNSNKMSEALTMVTNSPNGEIVFSALTVPTPAGTYRYTLEELDGPSGYITDSTLINMDITFDANGKVTNAVLVGTNNMVIGPLTRDDFEVGIKIANIKLYNFELIKEDAATHLTKIDGAGFTISASPADINIPSGEKLTADGGKITVNDLSGTGNITFTLTEETPPTGYESLANPTITFTINRTSLGVVKIVDTGSGGALVDNLTLPGGHVVEIVGKTVRITVKNEREPDVFHFKLVKIDAATGEKLPGGATFEITSLAIDNPANKETKVTGSNGEFIITGLTGEGNIDITIKETAAPTGYIYKEQIHTIKINRTSSGVLSIVDDGGIGEVEAHNESNTIIVTIPNYNNFDLALRKFITAVERNAVTTEITSRIPEVIVGTNGKITYNHTKQPVSVRIGDIVTYTIRVYNEGNIEGYVEEIKDTIPDGLEFILPAGGNINQQFGWGMLDEHGAVTTNVTEAVAVTTRYLAHDETHARLLEAFDYNKYPLVDVDYEDVKVQFKVVGKSTENPYMTNIAEINEDYNEWGVHDKDSYPGKESGSKPYDFGSNYYTPNGFDPNPGNNEDDIDVENLILPVFDLALRKFITGVERNGTPTDITNRIPVVVVNSSGKVMYSPTPPPLSVLTGDIVIYTIRIYNEGDIDGYAKEIKDHIPAGLEFLPDHDINKEYGWEEEETGIITTDYLSKEAGEEATPMRDNLLGAFDYPTMSTPNFRDVKVACKVVADNTYTGPLVNIAEISAHTDEDGNPIEDIDSTPDNWEPEREFEDDEDYEHIIIPVFDLALRKFITGVERNGTTTNITSRIPTPVVDSSGKVTYNHPKTPVPVMNGDIVIYTIRVYNEGDVDGYAKEVKDHIPEWLEFLPDHYINEEHGWKEEEEGIITTDYLSKEAGEEATPMRDNKLRAFDYMVMSTPDFRDVKVACKVIAPNTYTGIIVNIAEISAHTDEDGNPIEDIDSTPDNLLDEDRFDFEDDEDYELIILNYFDLALKKWVTKAIVNGVETPTGYTEDNKAPAKVEIKDKELYSTVVKFAYNIKVINEGNIAGYAKEVKDHIPAGLKFIQEDNPDWRLEGDVAVTENAITNRGTAIKDTLLQPAMYDASGNITNPEESTATVEIILTWINTESNLAKELINYAEISRHTDEDGNPIEDIDSTPDNWEPGREFEDDEDYAPVLVTIKTGGKIVVYFSLSGICLSMLGMAMYLIKKRVLV